MKTYHEIAGHRPENMVGLRFDADGRRSTFQLSDAYCDNPKCKGWETSVTLTALEREKRAISFRIDYDTNKMTASAATSDADMAIAKEFCSRKGRNLLLRRRQIVRAWGLAHQEGRLGPKRRFTGSCYTFRDFDKHNEPFIIYFTHTGEDWSVMDQYCVSPKCPCTHALLSFYRHRPGDTLAVPSFGVRLELKDGTFEDRDARPLAPEHQKTVESFLAVSQDWKQELDQRRRLLREIAARRVSFPPEHQAQPNSPSTAGERILRIVDDPAPGPATPPGPALPPTAPARSEPPAASAARSTAPAPDVTISRNAPCPCGSRRKYKECCGRAPS